MDKITLSKSDDGYWFHVELDNGNQASFNIAPPKGLFLKTVLDTYISNNKPVIEKKCYTCVIKNVCGSIPIERDFSECWRGSDNMEG